MKVLKLVSISAAMSLILCACATNVKLKRHVIANNFPHHSIEEFRNSTEKFTEMHAKPYEGKYMFYNYITLIINEGPDEIKKEKMSNQILPFLRMNTSLVLSNSLMADLSGDFINFFPRSNYPFMKPAFMTLDSTKPSYPYRDDLNKKRKAKKNKFGEFDYKSELFPHTFNFPTDIVKYYDYNAITSVRSMINNDYLILELPNAVLLNTRYTENGLKQRQIGDMPKVPVNDLSAYLLLFDKYLLLNPAFKDAYERSIKAIWELYLIGLKFENLGDILICDDKNDPLTWFQYYVLFKRPHPIRGCPLNLDSQNVMTYLSEAYENQPMMYKSYFELILWQMYETGDFTERDTKGKTRSYLFTSKNPKYPGNYEVKFNIYELYEFKVRKR